MRTGTASIYDPDALAYFGTAGVDSEHYMNAIHQFVLDLKTANIWNKFDRLWLFANENVTAALTCLKSLQLATAVNGPTLTAGLGFTLNGTSQYLNSNFSPNDAVQYQRNSAHFGCKIEISNGIAFKYAMGVFDTRVAVLRFFDGAAYWADINNEDNNTLNWVGSGRTGLWMINRSSSLESQVYHNGSTAATGSWPSQNVSAVTAPWFIGARNVVGYGGDGFFDGCFSMVTMGASFSASEAAAWNTCVSTLEAAIGF
jgi:hypothetical protein